MIFTEGYYALDARWRFLEVNAVAEAYFGRPAAELIGKNIWRETGTALDSGAYRAFEQAAARREPVAFVDESTVRPGRWYQFHVHPRAEDGVAVYFLDITDDRHAAEALRESEARHRELFEHMAEGFFLAQVICDDAGRPVDYRYLEANPAFEPLTGLARDQVLGRKFSEVLPGAEPYWVEAYGRVALTGQPARLESYAALLDRYYSTVAYSPRRGQFACLFSDISKRKRAEEELQRSRVALEQQHAFLRAVIDSMSGPLMVRDAQGRCILANEAAARLHGMSVSALEGADIGALPTLPATSLEQDRQVLATGQELVSEVDVVAADGQRHSLITEKVALRNAHGAPERVLETSLDVTWRKRAEQALGRLNAELAESDRRKDEFIAILSHELRNPLAPIRYAVPLLQAQNLDDGGRRAVAVINRQVDHLTRLVDDLLDVSRITRGKIELRREYVTLSSIVTAAAESASPAIVAARHKLTMLVPDEPIWLHADPARIAQVITNLLDNSAKYTPRGGEITLEVKRDNGTVTVSVRDTGMGIPADSLSTVFEMFRQVDRPDKSQGGLGIGLALVKRLVEMHEGTIEARSAGLNRGAEFVLGLPVARAGVEADTPLADSAPNGRSLRVLVVDDNVDLVEMLAMVVESSGHEVRKVLDGPSAVSAALSYRPHVVLLDLGLPGMSGIEVARTLRQRPEMAGVRIVALTGWGQAEDRRQTTDAGFDHHLTKPTDPQRVKDLLADIASRLGA